MKVSFENTTINLPDILILGAAKSGTTSLAFFLKQHPDVFMPRKEPGFFAYHDRPAEEIPSGIRDRQITDLGTYTEMYKPVGENQLICDASVAQFTNAPHTIRNLKHLYGDKLSDVKAFIILRNPADRAFSHYLMFVKNGLETLSFEDAIKTENVESRVDQQLGFDYLGGSMYAERIKAFQEVLPQLKVYLMDDLKDRDRLLADFLKNCGLRQDVDINTSIRLNPSGLPKNKTMIRALHGRTGLKKIMKRYLPDKMQFKLTAMKSNLMEKSVERIHMDKDLWESLIHDRFASDINELSLLLNRDLSHWTKKKQ